MYVHSYSIYIHQMLGFLTNYYEVPYSYISELRVIHNFQLLYVSIQRLVFLLTPSLYHKAYFENVNTT